VAATRLDLVIEQGADFDLVVDVEDDDRSASDLSGWAAQLQARESLAAATAVIDMEPDVSSTDSTVVIHIPAADTAGYEWLSAVYDLVITDGTAVRRLLQGQISVDPAVTRD
jgi:hypothetical protein